MIYIQQFQTSMAFFTLVPNYFPNHLRLSSPSSSQQPLSIHQHLLILSTALRTSILNYQTSLSRQNLPTASQRPLPQEVRVSDKGRGAAEPGRQETDKNYEISNRTPKGLGQQRAISSNSTGGKVSPLNSEEMENEKKVVKNQVPYSVLKQDFSQKIINCCKVRGGKEREESGVLLVKNIDNASLPSLGIRDGELEKRWVNLKKRRVQEWASSVKGRRERRQIRMLQQ